MLGRIFTRSMSGLPHMVRLDGSVVRRATLDDFPVPKGPWQEAYNEKQREYTKILGLGVTCLVATIGYIWKKDPFRFEIMLGPYKYMKNPPAFDSPVLEPNILTEWLRENVPVDQTTVATTK